ncbi:Alpha/beta hydrolase [Jatrophihabitans endophyticus]|uniref:Alpha/beta hydrolase n=1 Tax=Jatrophihabitans endophyticus TaxID=1206085 RepID=A0A1M5H906_9ACTN|nr:alpha/beta hydrolase [Jatrophihabitans endophyticus]SHG12222.1 Alpha/beta hydrolase [Jatrophihabitans endophyticus]
MAFTRADLVAAAGIDPWALEAKVAAGDPAQIDHLAAAFYRAGDRTAEAARAEQRSSTLVRHGYSSGGAALDYNATARQTRAHLTDASVALPRIARLLTTVAEDLTTARSGAAEQVRGLAGDLERVDAAWRSFQAGAGHHLPGDDQQAALAGYRNQAVDAVRARGKAVAGCIDAYEARLAHSSKVMADLGFVAPLGLREAAVPAMPPAGADPTRVAAWWKGLTPAEQQALLQHRYQQLGRLQGLPATVLNTANRHRLNDHLAELDREIAALRQSPGVVTGDPGAVNRLGALLAERGQDAGILQVANRRGAPPVFVLRYDPEAGDGQTGVAIALGDPDVANDTAVVVPGTGNNASKLSSVAGNGLSMYDHMSSSSKSVVVWLDGTEPQSIPDAASDEYADRSAPRLADDLAGLRAAHASASGTAGHTTAIGHSYGSYILGKALSGGGKVDDAVFVGSPGVGVDRAGDLHMSGDHVWSGQAGDDPIMFTPNRFTPGLSGNNPSEGDFGARHFDVSDSHGHSEYYQGHSLTNMARIADGNYAAVSTTAAPDHRGLRELPTDALDTYVFDPVETVGHTAGSLFTGHPIDAAQNLYHGVAKNLGDLGHTGEDIVVGAGHVAKSAWDWIT